MKALGSLLAVLGLIAMSTGCFMTLHDTAAWKGSRTDSDSDSGFDSDSDSQAGYGAMSDDWGVQAFGGSNGTWGCSQTVSYGQDDFSLHGSANRPITIASHSTVSFNTNTFPLGHIGLQSGTSTVQLGQSGQHFENGFMEDDPLGAGANQAAVHGTLPMNPIIQTNLCVDTAPGVQGMANNCLYPDFLTLFQAYRDKTGYTGTTGGHVGLGRNSPRPLIVGKDFTLKDSSGNLLTDMNGLFDMLLRERLGGSDVEIDLELHGFATDTFSLNFRQPLKLAMNDSRGRMWTFDLESNAKALVGALRELRSSGLEPGQVIDFSGATVDFGDFSVTMPEIDLELTFVWNWADLTGKVQSLNTGSRRVSGR